jgi:glycerate kinase
MLNLRRIIIRECGIDLLEVPGSGAAGGLGGAFKAFLNARLSKGIDMVLDAIGFDQAIQDADLIITGEGKIDSQTSKGKVISGITERARKHGIPVIAIAGICDIDEEQARQLGLAAGFAIGPRPQNESDLKAAMQPETASRNISETIAKALVSLSPSLFHGNP